jgi:hypothetical protein
MKVLLASAYASYRPLHYQLFAMDGLYSLDEKGNIHFHSAYASYIAFWTEKNAHSGCIFYLQSYPALPYFPTASGLP